MEAKQPKGKYLSEVLRKASKLKHRSITNVVTLLYV
jgi:hypothetical protein